MSVTGNAGDEVALLHVLSRPPAQQDGKTLLFGIDGPVELRHKIISPPLLQPLAGIRIESGLGVEAFDRSGLPGAPDAKRAEPEFDRAAWLP